MIKLGIIGMSPGNAHPSSWSAIINGTFNAQAITNLGYPAVAAYLQANRATLGLPNARVTHVLTQDKELSAQIALTGGIENIVENAEEMIAAVDAVLLCRDDPENHREMAKPFIDAGIPLFIDKPLCDTQEDLDYFKAEVAKGKFIMSCSSMRYAGECMAAKSDLVNMGKIELITAVGKKDWTKYGMHMLEAIFSIMDDPRPLSVINVGREDAAIVKIDFEGGLQATIHLMMDISGTFQLSIFGQQNWKLVDIKNSYAMFRDNIIEFIRSAEEGKPRLEFAKTEQIIKTLIAGNDSLKQGGKKIIIN
ncbi:Gfo/Idh/MocA family oxidoreductase [Mucilaginibacter mali]|uniref:Gfo/Idh/MocA family oxidoreductase n=1 Tax=Mucilaginibacter mali TaxID=2740462 RepID=A0A7D4TQF8_9SPHI|nr:Gfo/Idh/MocA family oxidoreductase [Mucilaginibacter mali]QKJ32633.1 Gfo/Idh/MocA family oxidoreductase [Mucilaginibacter mali]